MEKGILFNGAMVRAIINGRKTVTRRPFAGAQPNVDQIGSNRCRWITPCRSNKKFYGVCIDDRIIKAPISPGDRVYVRETWTHWYLDSETNTQRYWYAADYEGDERPDGWDHGLNRDSWDRWFPSIHMPKQAARIWMTVASVKPERLKDITEQDAKREGFESRAAFLDEWMRIYGEWTGCFWAWRIEFKDIEIKGRYES